MKQRILEILSFLTVFFYSSVARATGGALDQLIQELSNGDTRKGVEKVLYFDGIRFWVVIASIFIAVHIISLASDIGKDLGGTPLGGSVGDSGLKLTGKAASWAVKTGIPFIGKDIQKTGKDIAAGMAATKAAGIRAWEGLKKNKNSETEGSQQNAPSTNSLQRTQTSENNSPPTNNAPNTAQPETNTQETSTANQAGNSTSEQTATPTTTNTNTGGGSAGGANRGGVNPLAVAGLVAGAEPLAAAGLAAGVALNADKKAPLDVVNATTKGSPSSKYNINTDAVANLGDKTISAGGTNDANKQTAPNDTPKPRDKTDTEKPTDNKEAPKPAGTPDMPKKDERPEAKKPEMPGRGSSVQTPQEIKDQLKSIIDSGDEKSIQFTESRTGQLSSRLSSVENSIGSRIDDKLDPVSSTANQALNEAFKAGSREMPASRVELPQVRSPSDMSKSLDLLKKK